MLTGALLVRSVGGCVGVWRAAAGMGKKTTAARSTPYSRRLRTLGLGCVALVAVAAGVAYVLLPKQAVAPPMAQGGGRLAVLKEGRTASQVDDDEDLPMALLAVPPPRPPAPAPPLPHSPPPPLPEYPPSVPVRYTHIHPHPTHHTRSLLSSCTCVRHGSSPRGHEQPEAADARMHLDRSRLRRRHHLRHSHHGRRCPPHPALHLPTRRILPSCHHCRTRRRRPPCRLVHRRPTLRSLNCRTCHRRCRRHRSLPCRRRRCVRGSPPYRKLARCPDCLRCGCPVD